MKKKISVRRRPRSNKLRQMGRKTHEPLEGIHLVDMDATYYPPTKAGDHELERYIKRVKRFHEYSAKQSVLAK